MIGVGIDTNICFEPQNLARIFVSTTLDSRWLVAVPQIEEHFLPSFGLSAMNLA